MLASIETSDVVIFKSNVNRRTASLGIEALGSNGIHLIDEDNAR